MICAYLELRWLWKKRREGRRLPADQVRAWSEQVARDWEYMLLPHY